MNAKYFLGQEPYEIVDGPSVDKVVDLLRYAYSASRIDADFTFAIDDDIVGVMRNITMSSLGHESGDEWNWLIHGYCNVEVLGTIVSSPNFDGYFDAKTRKGWVRFQT